MHMTWHLDPEKTKFNVKAPSFHWLAKQLLYPGEHHGGDGKIGVHSAWSQHAFVLPKALFPVAAQYVSMKYFNYTWPLPLAFAIYATSATLFSFFMLFHFHRLSKTHGFLDAEHTRDGIPDAKLNWTILFLGLTLSGRPLVGAFMEYDRFELPSFSIWDPVRVFAFHCALDFWFYWYHRGMHEIPFLWQFHKTHHHAKHPIPLLSVFGDPTQDFFDILVIPLLATLTVPLKFHVWWISAVYILYAEAGSHTGVRVYWTPPITGPILYYFNMELLLEDHDLHHRLGWKKSYNYGKQTGIWDSLFGTRRERMEVKREDVDWNKKFSVISSLLE